MTTILDKIFSDKKEELESTRYHKPFVEIKNQALDHPEPQDFFARLRDKKGSRIIAEIKRRTPFKGDLLEDFDALKIARQYDEAGAVAISVLTEKTHFGGAIEFLSEIEGNVSIPLLRKDFIFSDYQVHEARAYGADAFLLIATHLETSQIVDLMGLGEEMGLTALIEAHDEKDMEKILESNARLIGINNRDLTSGKTDLNTCRRLYDLIRPIENIVSVCESGIHSREDIEDFEKMGIQAFLIGESLMRADDIQAKMGEFLGA